MTVEKRRRQMTHQQVIKFTTYAATNKEKLTGKTRIAIVKMATRELGFQVSDTAVESVCSEMGIVLPGRGGSRNPGKGNGRWRTLALARDVRSIAQDLQRAIEAFGGDPKTLLSPRTLAIIDKEDADDPSLINRAPKAGQDDGQPTLPFVDPSNKDQG